MVSPPTERESEGQREMRSVEECRNRPDGGASSCEQATTSAAQIASDEREKDSRRGVGSAEAEGCRDCPDGARSCGQATTAATVVNTSDEQRRDSRPDESQE